VMKHFLYILILLMLITPVSAITYRDEYYNYTHNADIIFNKFALSGDRSAAGNWMWGNDYQFQQMEAMRGKAIQIAIEKQNELLEEQNGLLRNMSGTKYKCEYNNGVKNFVPSYDCVAVV
jgi:hypothetical protein